MEYIYSIADYIEIIKKISHYGVNGFREDVSLYFRGESKDYKETSGIPNIARKQWFANGNEPFVFRECERRMPQDFSNCKTTFEKLVLMQHYGIPTRLLDVSMDSLVALFFSLYLAPKSKSVDFNDSVVLVYEVPKKSILNWHSDKVSIISNIAVYDYDDLNIKTLPNSAADPDREIFNNNESVKHLLHEIKSEKPHFKDWIKKEDLESIYCVHPLLNNSRIKAQQGAFLIFGINGDRKHLVTLDSNKGPDIRMTKIFIPQLAKKRIREELKLLGKTVDNVYPDWSGVSDYFERFYEKKLVTLL